MSRSPGALAAAILALCLWALPPAAAADPVSADQAAALVRAASGGRILDVRPVDGARPTVYRVKVLLDGGRVRIYRVDADSGRILP